MSGLRSICWKVLFYRAAQPLVPFARLALHVDAGIQVFLLLGDFDRARWEKTLSDSRSAYSALKEHFLRHINHSDEINSAVDPLTDDENVSSHPPSLAAPSAPLCLPDGHPLLVACSDL